MTSMTCCEYGATPNLPRRIVDMANANILAYHKNKPGFDHVFALVVLDAQERVHLELLKMRHPKQKVADQWWKFGFVPKTASEFDDNLDAERLLIGRNNLRRDGKYKEADEIRRRLESWNYEIGDEPGGTNWRVKP